MKEETASLLRGKYFSWRIRLGSLTAICLPLHYSMNEDPLRRPIISPGDNLSLVPYNDFISDRQKTVGAVMQESEIVCRGSFWLDIC